MGEKKRVLGERTPWVANVSKPISKTLSRVGRKDFQNLLKLRPSYIRVMVETVEPVSLLKHFRVNLEDFRVALH